MGSTISLGRILGIPLSVSYSWFFILALVTFILGRQFGDSHPSWSPAEQWLVGGVTSFLFFASVLVHELSHSILAIRMGIPVKGIILFIFGGVSQIAREAQRPWVEFIIAGVGPLSSLVLGGLFAALYFALRDVSTHLSAMAITLTFINISLGVFNMLPGFPLDGGRVLRSILWGATQNYWKATLLATRIGQGIAFLIIGGGLSLAVVFHELQGIWVAAVGWFLAMAAGASHRQFRLRQRLQGFQVRNLMDPQCPSIPAGVTLDVVAEEYFLPSKHRFYAVTRNDQCLGLITLQDLSKTPRDRWPNTPVEEAMRPLEELPTIGPEAEAIEALEMMEERNSPMVMVLEEERLAGLISQQGALKSLEISNRR